MAWTSDGREIVFSSNRGGSVALWKISVFGAEKPRRMEVGENAYFPAISPRANRLVYTQQVTGDINVWRLDLSDPAAPPVSLIASTHMDASAHYSQDGRRIVFRSDRTGADEICGGNNPLESEDGTGIFYNFVNTILKSAPDGSGETKVLDGVNDEVSNSMAVTSAGIYYRDAQLPRTVRFFSFSTGMSRLILTTERLSGEVRVSPDGHWLLYRQIDTQPGSDLMLVENFQ